MNRVITIVVVLAVIAVGAVVVLGGESLETSTGDQERSRDNSASKDLVGPHSPEPGSLSGSFVVARGEDCVVQLVDLERMAFSKSGPSSGCDFTVTRDGERAASVVSGQEPDDAMPGFELVEVGNRPKTLQPVGRLYRDPAWSPDGSRLAACGAETSSETVILDVEAGIRELEAGCWPSFDDDGSVVTRIAVDLTRELGTSGILVDGTEAIALEQLLDAAGASTDSQAFVLGHTTGEAGAIGVSLVIAPPGNDPSGSFQLWRDGAAVAVAEIPLFLAERGIPGELSPQALRDRLALSPNGVEVGIALEDGVGPLFVIDTRTGTVLGPLEHRGFDFSPDGRWVAVARPGGIDVYGPARDSEPTYQIPLDTPALAWR